MRREARVRDPKGSPISRKRPDDIAAETKSQVAGTFGREVTQKKKYGFFGPTEIEMERAAPSLSEDTVRIIPPAKKGEAGLDAGLGGWRLPGAGAKRLNRAQLGRGCIFPEERNIQAAYLLYGRPRSKNRTPLEAKSPWTKSIAKSLAWKTYRSGHPPLMRDGPLALVGPVDAGVRQERLPRCATNLSRKNSPRGRG